MSTMWNVMLWNSICKILGCGGARKKAIHRIAAKKRHPDGPCDLHKQDCYRLLVVTQSCEATRTTLHSLLLSGRSLTFPPMGNWGMFSSGQQPTKQRALTGNCSEVCCLGMRLPPSLAFSLIQPGLLPYRIIGNGAGRNTQPPQCWPVTPHFQNMPPYTDL